MLKPGKLLVTLMRNQKVAILLSSAGKNKRRLLKGYDVLPIRPSPSPRGTNLLDSNTYCFRYFFCPGHSVALPWRFQSDRFSATYSRIKRNVCSSLRNEAVAGRSAKQTVSCFHKVIKLLAHLRKIKFWLDIGAAQNKNWELFIWYC